MIALDTNVFIYYFQSADERKYEIARAIIAQALEPGAASISYQVVQETLNVLTTKISPAASETDVDRMMESVLLPLWRVMPSQRLYARTLELRRRYQLPYYDALVVPGALEAGCTRLLTEDLQHGQVIDGLTIENPSCRSPGSMR